MIYVAFLESNKQNDENRIVFPASLNVSDYIVNVLARIAHVRVFSPIRSANPSGYFPGRKELYAEGVSLEVPPSFGCKGKIGRFFSIALTQCWLLCNLLGYAKKTETVVAYHSLSIMKTLQIAKFLKGFRLVVEAREIYADVTGNTKLRKKELAFLQSADAYIFATDELEKIINVKHKPYVVSPGVYIPKKQMKGIPFDLTKTHIVYAGTFNDVKGGALLAIKTAEYLPENYHLHILGRGLPEEQTAVLREIDRVCAHSRGTVTYDGCLSGEAFDAFLQNCKVGLSTQDISRDFNISSFPSKILTYLSNGLQVVTGRIPAVESSQVGTFVTYYDENSPEAIARAVLEAAQNTADVRQALCELDRKLEAEMKNLLV